MTANTTTLVSTVRIDATSCPSLAACRLCKIILVSASSWVHDDSSDRAYPSIEHGWICPRHFLRSGPPLAFSVFAAPSPLTSGKEDITRRSSHSIVTPLNVAQICSIFWSAKWIRLLGICPNMLQIWPKFYRIGASSPTPGSFAFRGD